MSVIKLTGDDTLTIYTIIQESVLRKRCSVLKCNWVVNDMIGCSIMANNIPPTPRRQLWVNWCCCQSGNVDCFSFGFVY